MTTRHPRASILVALSVMVIAVGWWFYAKGRTRCVVGWSAGHWIRQLSDRDAFRRMQAIQALHEIGPEAGERAGRALAARLDDDDPDIVHAASSALSDIPAPVPVLRKTLLRNIRSDREDVRTAAVDLLGEHPALGTEAVPWFVAELAKPEPGVERLRLLTSLIEIDPNTAQRIIGSGLRAWPRVEWRDVAALVCDARLSVPEITPIALHEFMYDKGSHNPDWPACLERVGGDASALALLYELETSSPRGFRLPYHRYPTEPRTALLDSDQSTQAIILDRLLSLEEYTAELISRIARDSDLDLRLRRDAIRLMAHVRMADPCRFACDPRQPSELRREALQVLSNRGPAGSSCVEGLTAALKEQDCEVRLLAVRGLAAIGPQAERAVPALRALDKRCKGASAAARRAIEVISGADTTLAAGELSRVLETPGYPFLPPPRVIIP